MIDELNRRRISDGTLNQEWFWNHSDLLDEHKQNLKDIYRIGTSNDSKYVPLDFWKLHDNSVIFEGKWIFKNPELSDLHTICLSLKNKESFQLPYIVLPIEDEMVWCHRSIQLGYSPLKWWLNNRADEVKLFLRSCDRHLSDWDWHQAGVPWLNINNTLIQNMTELSKTKNLLLYP